MLCATLTANADITLPGPVGKGAEKSGGAAPLLQEAVPVNVRVRRGGAVEIPLRVFGTPDPSLRYRVRTPPEFGELSEPKMAGDGIGVVTYRHSGGKREDHDRFSFAAQTARGVSETVEVSITIVDVPPKLDVRDDLDFGTVTIGSSVVKEVTIENLGGGVLKGDASVDEPWRIEGRSAYKLRPGEQQKISLRFAPQLEQAFQGEVRYSGAPDQTTSLRAVGEAAIAISPSRLELRPAQDGARSAVLTIANRTTEELSARIRLGGRLKGPERVTLPPGGGVSVVIEASADDPRSIDGEVRVESPNFTTSVPLHAFAVGPVLRVSPESLSLGRIDAKNQSGGTLRIRNAGGTGTFVRAEPSGHVVIALADTSFWLEAGATRDIGVAIDPWNAGRYRERLTIKSDGSEFEIPVEADVTHGRAPAPTLVSRPFGNNAPGEMVAFEPVRASVGAPRLGPLRIRRITATTCEIDWEVPPNDQLGYKVESLAAASPDKQPMWRPISHAVIHDPRNPGKALGEEWVSHGVKVDNWAPARANTARKGVPTLSALIGGLTPDTAYDIRVSGIVAKSETPEMSPPLQIHTPRAPASNPAGLLVPMALLALTVRYKMRKRGAPASTDSQTAVPAAAFQGPLVSVRGKQIPFIRELGPGRFEIDCDDKQD